MAMVLDDDIGMLFLDHLGQLPQENRLADTRHVLQADLLCPCLDLLISQMGVVFERMDRRGRDAQGPLCCHTSFLCPLDRRSDIAYVIQSVEDTGNIHALCMLDPVHHLPHIIRDRIHTKGIQATVQHVGLDASLVQRLGKGTDSIVRVLPSKKIDLLEATPIRLDTGKATHLDEDWRDTSQLIFAWLKLTR